MRKPSDIDINKLKEEILKIKTSGGTSIEAGNVTTNSSSLF